MLPRLPDVLLRGGRAGSMRAHACATARAPAVGEADDGGSAAAPTLTFALPPLPPPRPPARFLHRRPDPAEETRHATVTAAAFAPAVASSASPTSRLLVVLGTSRGEAVAVHLRGAAPRFRRLVAAAGESGVGGTSSSKRPKPVTCASFLPLAPGPASAASEGRVALGDGDGRLRVFEIGGGGGKPTPAQGASASATARGDGDLVPPAAPLDGGRGAPVTSLTTSSSGLIASVTAQGVAVRRRQRSAGSGGGLAPVAAPPLRPVRCFPADPYPSRWAAVTPDGRAVLVVGGEGAGAGAGAPRGERREGNDNAGGEERQPPPRGRERGAVLTALSLEDGRVLARAALPLEVPLVVVGGQAGDGQGAAAAAAGSTAAAAALPYCFALSPDGATLTVGYRSCSSSDNNSRVVFHVLVIVDVARFEASRWLVLSAPGLGDTAAAARVAAATAGGATASVLQLAFLPGGRSLAALLVSPAYSAVAFAHVETGVVDGVVPVHAGCWSSGAPRRLKDHPQLLFALDDAADALVVVAPAAAATSGSTVALYDLPALREAWWKRRRRRMREEKQQKEELTGAAIPLTTTTAQLSLAVLPAESATPHPPPFRSLSADKAAWSQQMQAKAAEEAAAPEGSASAANASRQKGPLTARRLLRALEASGGVFPRRHRARIWSLLLRLPGNDAAFLGLTEDYDDASGEDEKSSCPSPRVRSRPSSPAAAASDHHDEARARRVAAALARWFPALGQPYPVAGNDDGNSTTAPGATTTTLALRLARPLCNRLAFGRDARAAFEAATTLLTHWCGDGWLAWCPGPPLRLIRRVFALLRLHDAELADALVWRAPLPVSAAATAGAWDWLSGLGGGGAEGAGALRPADWARVWDRVLCEGAVAGEREGGGGDGDESGGGGSSSPVELLYHFFAAWAMHHRTVLLVLARGGGGGGNGSNDTAHRLRSQQRLRAFFSQRHPLGPGGVRQLLHEALRLRDEATPPQALVGADAALAPAAGQQRQLLPGALPRCCPGAAGDGSGVDVRSAYPSPAEEGSRPLTSEAAMRAARCRAEQVERAIDVGRRGAAQLAALERALAHDLMAIAGRRSEALRGALGREWRMVEADEEEREERRRCARRAALQVALARAGEREEQRFVERISGASFVVSERRF